MTPGEYKPPGGKLARAELTTESGVITAARVSGDFFLEPEPLAGPTLVAIGAALAGTPAGQSVAELAARVRAAVPVTAELVGTTPEAIAVAVRRALGHADESGDSGGAGERVGLLDPAELGRLTAPWRGLAWRIVPEVARSAALNVALDEAISNRVGRGESPPTLRFWRWAEPAVILGRTQSLANEVDTNAAAEMGVAVVRRMTGGGAMFLQPHGAITYSLYLPESALPPMPVRQSYEVCEAWVIASLRELGVGAYHVPINDIACPEGKIGGAAQARRRGVILHHTTIAYDMDPGEMLRVLRIGREKLKDKGTASAAKRVSPLVRQTGLGRAEVVGHLLASFRARFGGELGEVTAAEFEAGEALVASKYGTAAWTAEFE